MCYLPSLILLPKLTTSWTMGSKFYLNFSVKLGEVNKIC